ncbi:MAG: dephospho-CoA kinase [Sphingomonas sp.]
MIVLGLTGSIGMGKSTVAAMFADAGVPVFDADAVVHYLQGPGGRVVGAIESAFPGTTGESGVDREALRAAVFGNPDAFARLEGIVHPAVGEEREAFFKANADAPLVLLDIPLLLETGGEARVDKVAVVSAPADVQRARVLGREGMTPERFESILARQLPDSEKRARADFVIDTGGALAETRDQVNAVIACLIGGAGG